jgi:hypothetical protein
MSSTLFVVGEKETNRFFMIIGGDPTPEEADDFINKFHDELGKVEEGFTVLADVRELNLQNKSMQKYIAQVMEFIAKKNPSKIARVVTPIIGMQITKLGAKTGSKGENFETEEEAFEYLNN